jgi:hypothetical protein
MPPIEIMRLKNRAAIVPFEAGARIEADSQEMTNFLQLKKLDSVVRGVE